MRFQFYKTRMQDQAVFSVDGIAPVGPNLSHWPGNRTPSQYRADTTTEMALRWARDPKKTEWVSGIEVVTNNHYDTDGVLSTWIILHPEEALRYESQLIGAAQAGDFCWAPSEEAVKIDLTLEGLVHQPSSPIARELAFAPDDAAKYQTGYEAAHRLFPGLLTDLESHRSLWQGEYQRYHHDLDLIKNRQATVRDYPRGKFSAVEYQTPLDFRALLQTTRYPRVLMVCPHEKGHSYSFQYDYFSWFDTVTPPPLPRAPLERVAARLNEIETLSPGCWKCTPLKENSPWFGFFCGDSPSERRPSNIFPARMETILIKLFAASDGQK